MPERNLKPYPTLATPRTKDPQLNPIYTIPDPAIVLLVGVSSSGKSTFARKNFKPTEILSSDFLRGIVCDDENNQQASQDAFEILQHMVRKRTDWKKLTVIDATHVEYESRKLWLRIAAEYRYKAVAILLDPPLHVVHERHNLRPDRNFAFEIITQQHYHLQQTINHIPLEGFHVCYHLKWPDDFSRPVVTRQDTHVP